MPHDRPFEVIGFHSCTRKIGLAALNGEIDLNLSDNPWDWLGKGLYFWEQNPLRSLEYGIESALHKQYNKVPIETPFVLGAIIELGNCLNLLEPESLALIQQAHSELEMLHNNLGTPLPKNDSVNTGNRRLDCAVIKHLHKSAENKPNLKYDTIRCAFVEGEPIYKTANFTSRLHIQVCVLNPNLIRGFFLPRPINTYNPYLKKDFNIEEYLKEHPQKPKES
jgi:hypothetical protein